MIDIPRLLEKMEPICPFCENEGGKYRSYGPMVIIEDAFNEEVLEDSWEVEWECNKCKNHFFTAHSSTEHLLWDSKGHVPVRGMMPIEIGGD